MRLPAREQNLVEERTHVPDLQERLASVVDRARRVPKLPPEERIPAHRVPGCSSSVWLIGELRDGRCHFRFDADSPVVRGLVGLQVEFFNGATPAEIAGSSTDPLELLGLSRTLTPTRRHGLAAVRAAIHEFARSHLPA